MTLQEFAKLVHEAIRSERPSFFLANQGPERDRGIRIMEIASEIVGQKEDPKLRPLPGFAADAIPEEVKRDDEIAASNRAALGAMDATPNTLTFPSPKSPPKIDSLVGWVQTILQGKAPMGKSAILAHMNPRPSDMEWNLLMKEAVASGLILRAGQKRGTLYQLPNQALDNLHQAV